MKELEIYEMITIEEFLRKFDLVDEVDTNAIAHKIRHRKNNAMRINLSDDRIVEIHQGVFKGNKAKILSQYEQKLEVRILDDKYDNVVVIDLKDIAEFYEEVKMTYVLT